MLEVAISSVVYDFLSVRLTFFTQLATSGGNCETNGDMEELLLEASPEIARARYFQRVPVDLFLNSLLATTTKSRLDC